MEQQDEILIPEIEEKPNKKRKLAVGIAAVCIVAATAAVVVAVVTAFAKVYFGENRALVKGLQNLAAEVEEQQELTVQNKTGAVNAETSFNVNIENLPVTLGIDTQILRDVEARKLRTSTEVSVMNMNLAKVEIYGEDETLAVAVPTIWEQNFVFDVKQIDRQYNDSLLAEKWGRIDGLPEISLDLFAESERLPWKELVIHCQEILKDLEIGRIEKKIAVNIPEKDNRQYQCSQYRVVMPVTEMIGMEWAVSDENMILLLSVDENDRIVQISLDEPFLLPEGELTGNVCFVGEDRSIDDIVVNMQIKGKADMSQLDESLLSEFGGVSMEQSVEIEMNAESVFDKNDTSVNINLDKLTVSVTDFGALNVNGSITLEPLGEEIEPLAGESIRIFEITEDEYSALEGEIMRKLLWKMSIAGKLFG